MRWHLLFASLLLIASRGAAQDWKPVTEELIAAEKPGFGKLCGVIVDHKTGDVIINLSDKGFYRSDDACKTWHKPSVAIKGRTETPGCLMLDPFGNKRMVSALVYGSPIVVSGDRGATWRALDKKSSHVDWCAVDWSDADMKFMLTLKHEAGDLLLVSRDAGKSFDEIGKGYGPAWIFDSQTAVVAQAKSKTNVKPGLVRTTDAGKTFEPCGAYYAKALPRWHKDTLYWVMDGALIATKDQGKSWQKVGALKAGLFGPIFGKNDKHLFVLTQGGIVESTDGGATWADLIAVPKQMKSVANLAWMEYDPTRDILYVMKMGSDLYQWQRK